VWAFPQDRFAHMARMCGALGLYGAGRQAWPVSKDLVVFGILDGSARQGPTLPREDAKHTIPLGTQNFKTQRALELVSTGCQSQNGDSSTKRPDVPVDQSLVHDVNASSVDDLNGDPQPGQNSSSTNCSIVNGNLVQGKEWEQPKQTTNDEECLQNVGSIPIIPIKQAAHYGDTPPLPIYELDRLRMDVDLQTFGKGLQQAAEAIFPNDDRSRYSEVHVLLLSWEDEDPNLPVSIEIQQLLALFQDIFGFETSMWKIPTSQSHRATNRRIDEFLSTDDPHHLKIVYYAGHGRLTSNGQLAWTRYATFKRQFA